MRLFKRLWNSDRRLRAGIHDLTMSSSFAKTCFSVSLFSRVARSGHKTTPIPFGSVMLQVKIWGEDGGLYPRDGLREGYDPPRNIHLHRQEKVLRKYKKLEWKQKTVFPSLCSARSSISLKESSVAHKRLHARTLFQRSCRCIPGSIAKIGKARKTG